MQQFKGKEKCAAGAKCSSIVWKGKDLFNAKNGRLNHTHHLCRWDEYREKETSSFLEKMYQNSGSKLFAALIENDALSEDDIQKIKAPFGKGKGIICWNRYSAPCWERHFLLPCF